MAYVRKIINEWVANQTEDRIQNIMAKSPPPATKLALVNAIYFKARWLDSFNADATKPEPFFAPFGQVSVQMMHRRARRHYSETPDAQVVQLPYGGHRRTDLVMVLVVPKSVDGLAAIERSLDVKQLLAWLGATGSPVLVQLAMPRFRIESSLSLVSTIAELGAPSVCTLGKSDLSGIDGTKELFLDQVLQKTFVEVDENGTEAAGATVDNMVLLGGAQLAPPKPIVVRADRPFLFLIQDVIRNRTLFIGRLVQPNIEKSERPLGIELS